MHAASHCGSVVLRSAPWYAHCATDSAWRCASVMYALAWVLIDEKAIVQAMASSGREIEPS
ncbi:MAG: hypothetical protein QOE65_2359 [Solirubrobacteraceae bacterium]|nr:hypothetical protein [Solirubrobacteraceae bacterium]